MVTFIFVKWIYSCYLVMTKLNKTESFLFYKELFESKNCPQSFQFSMKSDLAFFRAYDESNQLKYFCTVQCKILLSQPRNSTSMRKFLKLA